jgi:hypothetical protein
LWGNIELGGRRARKKNKFCRPSLGGNKEWSKAGAKGGSIGVSKGLSKEK